jgi:type III secretion protein J
MRRGNLLRASPALLAPLALALLTACETTVASGLPEAQANAVVVALDDEGIGAAKEPTGGSGDGWDVRVPQDDVGRALSVLRARDLPRPDAPGLAEVFGEPTLVPTATEEQARYVAALGGELAGSLKAIDGVIDARVHLALPEDRSHAFDEERPAPRASVLLRVEPGTAALDAEAQALIAGAVPELEREDVAVVSVEAAPVAERSSSLVRLGPIAVTRGSAPILKAVLGGAFGLSALLALGLIFAWLRMRRSPHQPEGSTAQPA